MSTRFRAALAVLLAAVLAAAPAPGLPMDDADSRLADAAAALRDGDAARAIALSEAVLAEKPSDVAALALFAEAHRAGGDLLAAEQRLESALAAAPEGDRPRLAREVGLVRLARAQALAIEGRGIRSTIVALFHDAARALETARAGGVSDDELVVRLAEAHDWAENAEAAERTLREALAERPASAPIRGALARFLLRQEGREAEAREFARGILESAEPTTDRLDVALAVGRMDFIAGDADRAFEALAIVLAASPSLQAVFDEVWDATASRRRFDLADRVLTLALARFPGDAKIPYYRAHARLLEGRLADAAADFGAALAIDPDLREARLGLAEARRRAGDRPGAVEAIATLLAKRPDDAAGLDALRGLAEEIAIAGDDARARELFEIVSRARPSDRETRVNWSVACARTGRLDDARRILEEGIARDPADARLRNELGIALEAAHLADEAERAYRAALDVAWSFDAAENLAYLLLRSGRRSDAVPLLGEILRRDPIRLRSAIAYERATRD